MSRVYILYPSPPPPKWAVPNFCLWEGGGKFAASKGGFKKKVNGIFDQGGWVGPRRTCFPLKRKNIVLKHFILPEMHFKANLFFFNCDPP